MRGRVLNFAKLPYFRFRHVERLPVLRKLSFIDLLLKVLIVFTDKALATLVEILVHLQALLLYFRILFFLLAGLLDLSTPRD